MAALPHPAMKVEAPAALADWPTAEAFTSRAARRSRWTAAPPSAATRPPPATEARARLVSTRGAMAAPVGESAGGNGGIGGSALGGGIYVGGIVELDGSNISGNTATAGHGGDGGDNFDDVDAGTGGAGGVANGGGIYLIGGGQLTLENSSSV